MICALAHDFRMVSDCSAAKHAGLTSHEAPVRFALIANPYLESIPRHDLDVIVQWDDHRRHQTIRRLKPNVPKEHQRRGESQTVHHTAASGGEGGLGHGLGEDVYLTYHNGKCYQLEIRIGESSFANYDPGTIKEFKDYAKVSRELRRVLESFRFLK